MITTPGVTYRMFKALSKHKINILVISTSEIKISVLIKRTNVKKAIKVYIKNLIYKIWKLDLQTYKKKKKLKK